MRVRVNLTNRKFGLLTALAPCGYTKTKRVIWSCLCECGNKTEVRNDYLTRGHTRSCGCLVTKSKYTLEQMIAVRAERKKDWARRNVAHVAGYNRSRSVVRHGLTAERYDKMLADQNGLCAICKRSPTVFGVKHLDIDHDHRCCPGVYSCGKCVRGLICIACNRALGLFQDNPEILRIALEYLKLNGAVETERRIPERGMLQSELHGDMQSAAEMTAPAKIN
jgi:Recombination endonuclease VII